MGKSILFNIVSLVSFAVLLSSCATIIGGRSNTLVLRSASGPQAEVYLDGELIGQAPGKIKLAPRRIQHGSRLEVRAEGHTPQEFTILRRPSPVYIVADIMTTAGVVLIVDFADGHIYRPRPRKIEYDLERDPDSGKREDR